MKKISLKVIYLLLGAIILTALYSCGSGTKNEDTSQGFLDLSARDTSVSPAQDFFEYANGTWMKNAKIPEDQFGWGSFFTVQKKLNDRIKNLLDSCSSLKSPKQGSPAQQIAGLYTCAMDSNAIDKAGLSSLQSDMDRIRSIKDADGIVREMANEYKNGDWMWDWYQLLFKGLNAGQLFAVYVFTDDKNSNITRFHCDQGGLGLPDKTYYFKTDSTSRNIVVAYKNYIAEILRLSGDSAQADNNAAAIFSLEKMLAKASKTLVQRRDPEANYHLMSVGEMNRLTPNIHWNNLLNEMGVQADTLLVGQPEYYQEVSKLLASEPVDVWKKYLSFHLVRRYAPWLSDPFAKPTFDFYSKLLMGQQKQKNRWERVANLINNTLGDDLGQLYVKQYFPPSSKAYMMNLVDSLKSAFKDHIENLAWMSDSTKAKALDKLSGMVKKIGYPDHWKDYSSVTIDEKSLITDLKSIGQWYYQYDMDKLHKPVDRSEWLMTPTTVNAYYNSSANDINFPAGILVPPFYFINGDDALNYGGIGMVIGHEMTHGFDDQGSQYDKEGNLKNWWTKTDREEFEKRAQQVIKMYSNYTIQDTIHLDGARTEGENIADIGGLSLAYSAFKKTKEGQSDNLINGLTSDQRFFLSFAQSWRIKMHPQSLLLRVNTDFHSPAQFRVNGPVSNMPAFYKAFNVKPGDKMYRPDSVRVHIW